MISKLFQSKIKQKFIYLYGKGGGEGKKAILNYYYKIIKIFQENN